MRFEPALRRTLSNNAPGGRERNMRLGCAYFLGFPRGRERNMRAGTSYFRGFLGGVNGTCSEGANSINPIGHLITHFGLVGLGLMILGGPGLVPALDECQRRFLAGNGV